MGMQEQQNHGFGRYPALVAWMTLWVSYFVENGTVFGSHSHDPTRF